MVWPSHFGGHTPGGDTYEHEPREREGTVPQQNRVRNAEKQDEGNGMKDDKKAAVVAVKRPELGVRGGKFWDDVTGRWDLTLSEGHILLECARLLDEVELLAAAIAEHGATVAGAAGQVRPNPALGEVRQHRIALARLLSQLGLPELDGETLTTPRQASASTAARSRWQANG